MENKNLYVYYLKKKKHRKLVYLLISSSERIIRLRDDDVVTQLASESWRVHPAGMRISRRTVQPLRQPGSVAEVATWRAGSDQYDGQPAGTVRIRSPFQCLIFVAEGRSHTLVGNHR